jgi:hypothetical protein
VSLRRRMAVTTAVAVGVAVLLAAAVAYGVVRGELRGLVDDQLMEQAQLVQRFEGRLPRERLGGRPPRGGFGDIPAPPERRGGTAGYIQFVPASGDKSIRLGATRCRSTTRRGRSRPGGRVSSWPTRRSTATTCAC